MTTRDQLAANLEMVKTNKDSTYHKLTFKQQCFVADYIKTGNGTQAVCDSYDVKDRDSAKVMAHKLKRAPRIRQTLLEIYEEAGVTMTRLAQVTKKGLNAKKTHYLKGKLLESDCDDHTIQLGFAKFALDIIGPSLNQ